MPEKVGKLATTIHALTCVFNGQQVTNHIPRSAVEAAVKFVKFAADQVATLYTEFSDRSALAPNLAKILLVAERKGGKISIRDAQLAFTSKFRPSAQMTRSWFGELVALGYGVVQKSGTGKSLIFEITSRLQDHRLQQPSNSIPVSISASTATDPTTISCLQAHSPTVGVVGEMIHSRLQTEPIQEESLRSLVGDDPVDDHLSEKIENQNVSDCVKFIRATILENDPQAANCKTAPKLNFEFGSRFTNKFLSGLILIWVVQIVTG